MSNPLSTANVPVSEQPLDEFSNCHAGILDHLGALDRLPALLGPAAEARRIAAESLAFFKTEMFEHHREEERELFPAVIASATTGAERDDIQRQCEQLTQDHREIEAEWQRVEPQLKAVAKGQDAEVDVEALHRLVQRYRGHARFEETQFLPACQRILGRDGNHLAALGVSLHMRRALPGVMERFGHRI